MLRLLLLIKLSLIQTAHHSNGFSFSPLHKKITSNVFVSTYQSITGNGAAVQQLENEYAGVQGEMAYKYPIHCNAIPQCDSLRKMDIPKKR
jgi:aspartate-semialdehyde dehydrogenase